MNVLQGWWGGNGIWDAEAEALPLSGAVVRILPDDYYLCVRQRGQRESAKLHPCWGIHGAGCPLVGEALDEQLAIWGCENGFEDVMPVWRNIDGQWV